MELRRGREAPLGREAPPGREEEGRGEAWTRGREASQGRWRYQPSLDNAVKAATRGMRKRMMQHEEWVVGLNRVGGERPATSTGWRQRRSVGGERSGGSGGGEKSFIYIYIYFNNKNKFRCLCNRII